MKRIISIIAFLVFFTTGVQAQILGATDNENHQENPYDFGTLKKPTGHYLRFELGYPNMFTLGYGYQVNPYIMFGVGGGIGNQPCYQYTYRWANHHASNTPEIENEHLLGSPIYAELVLSTPRHQHALTADFKIGGSMLWSSIFNEYYDNGEPKYIYTAINPFFFMTSLGYRFVNFGIDLGASYCGLWSFAFNLSYNLPLKVNK